MANNKTDTYQDVIMSMPSLKLIVADAKSGVKKAPAQPARKIQSGTPRSKHEIVIKIIEYLTKHH
jgi:hypothetical protein